MSKATQKEIEIHQNILGKDDLALAKLFDLYGEHVIDCLRRWYSKTAIQDDALILEATNEAFFGYFNNPGTYNPMGKTLERFLEIAAERDLINILERERRHSQKESIPDDVELEEKFWNRVIRSVNSADEELIRDQTIEIIQKELEHHFKNETDIQLAKLVLAGERETETFSELLQLGKLSIEEQRSEVKKSKDRIKKVLKRNQVELKLKKLLQ